MPEVNLPNCAPPTCWRPALGQGRGSDHRRRCSRPCKAEYPGMSGQLVTAEGDSTSS